MLATIIFQECIRCKELEKQLRYMNVGVLQNRVIRLNKRVTEFEKELIELKAKIEKAKGEINILADNTRYHGEAVVLEKALKILEEVN